VLYAQINRADLTRTSTAYSDLILILCAMDTSIALT